MPQALDGFCRRHSSKLQWPSHDSTLIYRYRWTRRAHRSKHSGCWSHTAKIALGVGGGISPLFRTAKFSLRNSTLPKASAFLYYNRSVLISAFNIHSTTLFFFGGGGYTILLNSCKTYKGRLRDVLTLSSVWIFCNPPLKGQHESPRVRNRFYQLNGKTGYRQ